MEGTAGAQAASSPISKLPFAAEGLGHPSSAEVAAVTAGNTIRQPNRCWRCRSRWPSLATCTECNGIVCSNCGCDCLERRGLALGHREKLMQRVVARRLAALERVADFLFAGQEAAWLRQLLREWRVADFF